MTENPNSSLASSRSAAPANASDRSYGVAVVLSAVFGIFGIHHFYLGRIMHGLFDLTLSVVGIGLIMADNWIGFVLIAIDYIHTIAVTFMLLVGSYKDGDGRLVAYPGQFK